MNILLVDDDVNVLESLQLGVSYSALGIEKVYVAESAEEAKTILKSVPIHIMVTDIEMPNESGIELLKWTKKEHMDIVTIFCTCYADFNYAKKAVELQCFDYYLKPISFNDFEKIIFKAVEKVKQENLKKTYYKYGVYWVDDVKNRKAYFWEHIMFPLTTPDEELIKALIEENRLEYESTQKFDIFLLHIYESEERFQKLTPSMSEFIIKNVVKEIFSEVCSLETVIKYGDDAYVVVTQNIKENASVTLKRLRTQCNSHLNCKIRIFYDLERPLSKVKKCFETLIHIWNENACNGVQAIWIQNYRKEEKTYSFGATSKWEIHLNNGAVDQIVGEIEDYCIEKRKRNELSAYELKALQANLLQMVNSVLMKNNIEAHELFVNAEYEAYRKDSLKNHDNYMRFCKYLLNKAYSYVDYVKGNASIVYTVKQYIDQHYNEEISRNELAKIVYLNADYLARLFKKKEGISITDYIIKVRMQKVSELLLYSDSSINEIAMEVGYDNFSYFSKLCKKMLGCSPKDYRKIHKGDHK